MRAALHETVAAPPARAPWYGCAAEALAVAALLPLAAAVAFSLAGAGGAGAYAQWWGTPRGWAALGRTLHLAGLAAALAVVLAWVLVAGAGPWPRRWGGAVAWLACLPMLVPSSLVATAWIVALGREGPLTRAVQAALGDVRPDVYSLPAAALVLALRYFGLAALVIESVRRRQAAGWPAERVFRIPRGAAALHLHLRPALGATLAAGLLVMLFAMNDHIIPGVLLVSTYGTQVLIQYSALLDPQGATALAAPMAAVGAAAAAVVLWGGKRTWRDLDGPAPTVPAPRSAAARALGAAAVAAVLALALAVPAVVLAQGAGSWRALGDALAVARREVLQTLFVSAVAGALCMAAAALLAARWVSAWRRGVWTAAPLVLLNLTVPPSLLGIGTIQLTQSPGLDAVRDTCWPLVFGYVARFLPVATLVLYGLWRREPSEPLAAARVHGVSGWQTAWRVLWPRHRRALVAAGLLAALLAATELETSILLAPAGAGTLGVRLYTLIHTAPPSVTSALALDILILVGPAILVLGWLLAQTRGRASEGQ